MSGKAGDGRILRVAAYCRVSTDSRDQVNSFESQKCYFGSLIARQPLWQLQQIYADEGLSGTDTAKREAFHRMLQAAEEGRIDLILTKEVSRFARNTVDALQYTRHLRTLGVGVLFLSDGIHTLEADGELRLTLMASLAQEESRKTSQRVKWGQRRRMEQGVVFGPSLLGYTVRGGAITPEPEGAAVVQRIYSQYLREGKSCAAIAAQLQQEGIPSSRGEVKWSGSTVRKILKNEKYCGDLVQQKTYTPDFLTHRKQYNRGQRPLLILRDHHEAIVSRSCWDAVQLEMEKRGAGREKAFRRQSYPLSGKIRCGCCRSSFVSRRKGERLIWRCGKAVRQGSRVFRHASGELCGCDIGQTLRDDLAGEMLRQALASLSFDRSCLAEELCRLILKQQELGGRQDTARQAAAWQRKKQRLLDAYLAGTVEEEDYCHLSRQYSQRLAALQKREQEASVRPLLRWEMLYPQLLQALETGEIALWAQLLEQIEVCPKGRFSLRLKKQAAQWVFSLSGDRRENGDSVCQGGK